MKNQSTTSGVAFIFMATSRDPIHNEIDRKNGHMFITTEKYNQIMNILYDE